MADIRDVVVCKVHPAIGIARVGNSPEEMFIGPELPGIPSPPEGGYKDAGDARAMVPPRIKRQGARFRIYGYDKAGTCLGEITSLGAKADATLSGMQADIVWSVDLANTKAEFHKFRGRAGEDPAHPPAPLRNKHVTGARRRDLRMHPAPVDIAGPRSRVAFDSVTFMDSWTMP
jgi:hypothetical protein